jgi:hypothetical protein
MTNSPLPEDDNIDHNIQIDQIIEDKLFDNRYAFREHMTDGLQFDMEMLPYLEMPIDPRDE